MMKRKLSPAEEAAVQGLRNRLVLTIRFFEDAQDFPSGAPMLMLVQDAAERGDLRKLRLISREVDKMTIALAPHERDGLEAIVRQRFGFDKDAERAELKRQVAAVIARGTVESEKERRRLEDYAEMLEAIGGDVEEIEAVRRLVSRS